MNWTIEHMPSQEGRVAIVTGANSGLGYYTVIGLVRAGADVIMACRNLKKGSAAMNNILADHPGAKLTLRELDLADLQSVKSFSEGILKDMDRLDLLINNAGLMAIPYRKTADGFEMQFGVNHLGHFTLTGQLIPLMMKTAGARIVNVSSLAHNAGEIRFNDLAWEKGYSRWKAYGMSKLANLLFTFELQKRLTEKGSGVLVTAAHPGYSDSELITKGPEMNGAQWMVRLRKFVNRLFAQSSEMGALPTLFAAVADEVEPGGYYGPDGFQELKGFPKRVYPNPKRISTALQQKLWEVSRELTGVSYPV